MKIIARNLRGGCDNIRCCGECVCSQYKLEKPVSDSDGENGKKKAEEKDDE